MRTLPEDMGSDAAPKMAAIEPGNSSSGPGQMDRAVVGPGNQSGQGEVSGHSFLAFSVTRCLCWTISGFGRGETAAVLWPPIPTPVFAVLTSPRYLPPRLGKQPSTPARETTPRRSMT